ncbi:MAG: ABC transporter substrate-binding protein [Chloroflexota bacterium]
MKEDKRTINRRQFVKLAALAAATVGSGGAMLTACSATPAEPTKAPAAPTTASKTEATPVPKPAATQAPAAKPAAQAATRPMVMAQKIEPITLDPHVNDFGYSQFPQRCALESLVNYEKGSDGQYKLVGVLADSWEASSDAKVWTIKLRKDIKFTDGTAFDAEAAKWNFDRIFTVKRGPQGRLPVFASMDLMDAQTLKVTLEAPFAPFMDTLAKPLMVSPTAVKKNDAGGDDFGMKWAHDHPVGTGPYTLENWVKGQQLTFLKNPNYWRGWDGNHMEKVIIQIVKEAATQRMMLETGDADFADGIAFDDLDAVSKAPGVEVEAEVSPQLIHLMLRQKGPLKDKRVRQALQYAFDYDSFISGVFNGRAKTPRGPLPQGIFSFDSSLPESKRDVAKAKQLLSEAGFANGGLDLVCQLIPPFGWFQPREGQILQQNLKELGINLTLDEKVDAAVFTKALQEQEQGPDIYAWTYNNSLNDPDDNFRRMYRSDLPFPKGTNGTFYDNPRVDELIDQGVSTADSSKRLAIYKELQKIVLEDAPAIFVAQPDYFVTRREVFMDFPYHPFAVNNGIDWWKPWLSK